MHGKITKYVEQFAHLGGYNLEVGSLNVNGTIRDVVHIDVGVDMREGKDVDQVVAGEDLPYAFPAEGFDMVVTCETLEHVRNWREFLQGIWYVLKDDGHLVCTLASKKKGRHAYPDDYWRMTPEHVHNIFAGNDIVDVTPDLGVSFGFVVRKRGPLIDLSDLKLLPVDGNVPKELL